MKEYWPMAEYEADYKDAFGNKLWTYDSCLSREKAEEAISTWEANGYHITKAWIDVTEDGRTERVEIKL